MAGLLAKVVVGAAGVGVVTTGAVQVLGGEVAATAGGSVEASVVSIVDGDTLDVSYGGDVHRVRLLNVDAPESKDPNRPVECLGQAASAFLAEQLPSGTEVTLQFDEDLLDPYDRELAGVLKDDVLINAEIARAGLGVPVYFAPNQRFLADVEAAHDEARSTGVGLYDPAAECSIPAQVARVENAQKQLLEGAPADDAPAADIAAHLEALESHRGEAAALLLLLGGDATLVPLAGYSAAELSALRETVQSADTGWSEAESHWQSAHDRAVTREEEAKAQEEAQEQAKREAEEQAQREAEAQAEREAEERRQAEEQAQREAEEQAQREAEERRQAEEEARRTTPTPAPAPAPSPAPAPAPAPRPAPAPEPPPANPGLGYTGCRDYSKPGPYFDDKGRGFMPIDCDTKAPLVP